MALTAETVVGEMRADPLEFLRHYKLSIAGGAAGAASGVCTFRFFDFGYTARGFTTGLSGLFGRQKDRPVIQFQKLKAPAKPHPDIGEGEFNAHYVAMITDAHGVAGTHHVLPTGGPASDADPDVMLTSQLSGCTFGVGSRADGALLVTHVQPNQGADFGAQSHREHLHQTVVGGFGGGEYALFERENQAAEKGYGNLANRATIIGLRGAGGWTFYAQTFVGAGGAVLHARKL